MHTLQFCHISKRSRRAHISPEEDWNFPGKNCQKLGYFCFTKLRIGKYLRGKRYKEAILLNNKSNKDPTELNSANQSNTKSC